MKEKILNLGGNPQIRILYQKTSEDFKVDSLEDALKDAPNFLSFLNKWYGKQNIKVANKEKQIVKDFISPIGAPMFEVSYPILFTYEGREEQLGIYKKLYDNTYGTLMDIGYEGELEGLGENVNLSLKALKLMKINLHFFP